MSPGLSKAVHPCLPVPAEGPWTGGVLWSQALAQLWPPFPIQLLVAHVRFTIAINTKAREQLICEYGLFDKVGDLARTQPHPQPACSGNQGGPAVSQRQLCWPQSAPESVLRWSSSRLASGSPSLWDGRTGLSYLLLGAHPPCEVPQGPLPRLPPVPSPRSVSDARSGSRAKGPSWINL